MGISPFHKSSMCSCSTPAKALPNPNPLNFIVEKSFKQGNWVMLLVYYPDCTTFEGRKILVFKDVPFKTLEKTPVMDPHFCDNSAHPSPLARFPANEDGWTSGKLFINLIVRDYAGQIPEEKK